MRIYTEVNDMLDHMFSACTTSQISEFIPEKRGFRIYGHSTTICLERAFWNVLDDMARESKLTLPRLIERVHEGCLVANDKNIASCLRVICLKYLNVYSAGVAEDRRSYGRKDDLRTRCTDRCGVSTA